LAVKKNDFVLMDFVAKVKESNEVFDTSSQDIARKEHIFRDGVVYEPMLVAVGEGWVLRGLDEGLVGLDVDKSSTVEIPPEKGFGPRDPSKIKLMPLRKFKAEKLNPYPGMQLEIDGKIAVIRTVGAGRVQADFNPPLAGKTLVYDLSIKKIIETKEEKIQALIHRRFPAIDIKKFTVKPTEKEVTIELPEEAFLLEALQYAKRGVVIDVQKFFSEIENVTFLETYKKKAPPAPKAEPTPTPELAPTPPPELLPAPAPEALPAPPTTEEEKPQQTAP